MVALPGFPAQSPLSRVVVILLLAYVTAKVHSNDWGPVLSTQGLLHELLGFTISGSSFQTSARGQASEASWSPGFWESVFCDSIV
jgi:hypothetical protein